MGKPFANSRKTKEATPSQSHQAKMDMYKAVMKRKLAREDYFTAQFKVRNILEAAVNSDKEKFKEIFTTFNMFKDFESIIVSYNKDDPEASIIRVIVQHKHWPYGGFRLLLALFADGFTQFAHSSFPLEFDHELAVTPRDLFRSFATSQNFEIRYLEFNSSNASSTIVEFGPLHCALCLCRPCLCTDIPDKTLFNSECDYIA